MKDAQKPDHASLSSLLTWLREGRFVVPDFQREFEWEPWDIQDLVRSIFLDYYIGSLLLWKSKSESIDALSCEPIYGLHGTDHASHVVLDGQQRLTAMFYAFVGPDLPLPKRTTRAHYYVRIDRFMAEDYDEAFGYEFTTKKLQALLRDRNAQYDQHFFPCSVLGAGGWDLPNWVQGYEDFWRRNAANTAAQGDGAVAREAERYATNARAFGDHLRDLTQQYQISYIELDQDLSIDKVCDIFTQLNSKGIRLDVFDLMNALLKPKDLQLKQLWREAAPSFSSLATDKMNVYVLQVMSILRQAYCSPKYLYFLLPGQEKPIREPDGARRKEVLVSSVDDFAALWQRAVDALRDSLKLLYHPQEFGVISRKYLPYAAILPAFAALQSSLENDPPAMRFSGQQKIRRWYWASVFTKRYSGAVESKSTRDYLDVRAWIEQDRIEPEPVREFKSQFSQLDLEHETNSGSAVYNGVFNLLIVHGARDWISGNIAQRDDLDDHHIVPASWGAKHLPNGSIHSILNRTPLTAETNRHVIGNNLPNVYLRQMLTRNGEASVLATLASHCISPAAFQILLHDPFTPDDFAAFIAERKRTILDAIEDLLMSERVDLPPRLKELDTEIEQVELALRRLIAHELGGESLLLPQHVLQRARERIETAARRNPLFDRTQAGHLPGILDYFDLRELQSTIISKPVWPLFANRFGTKETLDAKFGQLAELRNSLRHSRHVDEITRKEGEAAILWLRKLLPPETGQALQVASVLQ